jgi:hypothetical protein
MLDMMAESFDSASSDEVRIRFSIEQQGGDSPHRPPEYGLSLDSLIEQFRTRPE